MKNKPLRLAIFDIDGTIFRSSLLIELTNQFVQERIFPKRVLQSIADDYAAWVNRTGTYEKYIQHVVDVYASHIAEKRKIDVERVARKVIREQHGHMYRFTRDLIRRCQRQGYFLIAVSGSPHEIVSTFVSTMVFDAAFGTLYETQKGVYTGKIFKDNSVRNKARVIKEFLEETGQRADFSRSLAVGDTEGDIPVLSLVGNPIAFNPNKGLMKYARAHAMRIVVERKDVMYDLKNFDVL